MCFIHKLNYIEYTQIKNGTKYLYLHYINLYETELRAFFLAITALSLFILCLFFLEEEKNVKWRVKVEKMHGVPFHHKLAVNDFVI